MTHDKINTTILQIRNLETKAQALQLRLNELRWKWEKKHERVKNTREWQQSCNELNLYPQYDFSDLFA